MDVSGGSSSRGVADAAEQQLAPRAHAVLAARAALRDALPLARPPLDEVGHLHHLPCEEGACGCHIKEVIGA